MKLKSRKSKAVIMAAGTGFTKIAGLVSAIILARYLSKSDYSTYRQVLLAYSTVAPLLALGLPKALYYFLPGEEKRAGGVFLENFIPLCAMGLLFMVGLQCGGAELLAWRFNNPDLASALIIFAPYALFMLPQGAFTACMMARDRVQHVAVFQPFSRLVMAVAVVAVALVWRSGEGAIVGAVVGAGFVFLPTVYLMFHVCRGASWRFSLNGIKQQYFYGIPLGVAAMVGDTAGNIDKLLISSMGTPDQFAVYVNGAMQLPLVGIITGSIIAVLLPDMAKHFKAREYTKAIEIWKRAAVKCGLILIPAGIFLAVLSNDLMALLYSERYRDSGIPFAFYAILLPLRSISFGTPLIAAGRSRLALFESCIALFINIFLSIIAIRIFGYIGAAMATVIVSYLWSATFNAVMIGRTYETKLDNLLPWKDLARILAISLLALLPLLLLRMSIANLGLKFAIFLIVYSGSIIIAYLLFGLVSSDAAWKQIKSILP